MFAIVVDEKGRVLKMFSGSRAYERAYAHARAQDTVMIGAEAEITRLGLAGS